MLPATMTPVNKINNPLSNAVHCRTLFHKHGNLSFDDLLVRRTDEGEASEAKLDIKIIDFCLNRHVNPAKYIAQIQDRKYGNPPEAKDGVFTGQGDMWTIGSMCFKLLTGDMSQ